MRFVATRRYKSSYSTAFKVGPFEPGTVVDIPPEVAAAFNRDSPGILVPEAKVPPVVQPVPVRPVSAPPVLPAEEPPVDPPDDPVSDPAARDLDAPPADRAVRRPYKRRGQ